MGYRSCDPRHVGPEGADKLCWTQSAPTVQSILRRLFDGGNASQHAHAGRRVGRVHLHARRHKAAQAHRLFDPRQHVVARAPRIFTQIVVEEDFHAVSPMGQLVTTDLPLGMSPSTLGS